MEKTDTRTIADLAREAIQVQDACNILAVANGLSRAISRLRAMGHQEADHPIIFLWVDKLSSLSGHQSQGFAHFSKQYDLVVKLSEGQNV